MHPTADTQIVKFPRGAARRVIGGVRRLSIMKTKKILLAVALTGSLTAVVAVNAQKPVVIKGGEFCEKYLLKKIAKEKATGSRMVKLRTFNPKNPALSPNLKKWLQYMRKDELVAFELTSGEKKAMLLGSTSYGATGLATGLECWHIEGDVNQFVTYLSFSRNPKLVFWDKDGRLNYYSIVYSDEFIHNHDWDNLTFALERHQVSPEGSDRLVSVEQNVKCE
jgi:hypothetical protein